MTQNEILKIITEGIDKVKTLKELEKLKQRLKEKKIIKENPIKSYPLS